MNLKHSFCDWFWCKHVFNDTVKTETFISMLCSIWSLRLNHHQETLSFFRNRWTVHVLLTPWKMPLTAQFQLSLDYHTLSVLPRKETQWKCSISVNIDCVFSRLYCALIYFLAFHFCCRRTICYVVQYAVHIRAFLCKSFSEFLLVFLALFFQ